MKDGGRGEAISPLRRDGLVILLWLALTCVMTNPLVLHIARAVEDKQDALLNTWIIAWVGHALITDPLNLFNANIFYPYPNTLAYSETLLPQGLFALPCNLAFGNTILGYNLVLLASFFLAAYAMYLFVFDLTRSRGAGIIAGTIFAFNPYNLGNLAQVQLLSFGWLPLAMMGLRRLLSRTANPPHSTVRNLRVVLLFALCFSLQALSSFYYAFLAGLTVVLYIVWHFFSERPPLFAFVRVLVSALLSAILVIPFFIPYFQVQREMGFERKVIESEPFSASLKLYTEVAPHNVLYGKLLAPKALIFNGGYPLDNLFPGILAVVLASVGLTAQHRQWFYGFLLMCAFLLSLGPRLYLAPNQPTDLTLPYRWLYDWFPLMRALRAPVRFDALVMFALAVLAAFGVQPLTTADRRLPSLLPALIALEYLAVPAANITPVPVWNEIPEYVRWLRTQAPGVILEVPLLASDPSQPLDLTSQYLSTYHWHTTPDGYSGFNPPRRGEIAYEMQFFPNERSMALLQALEVRYVVSHRRTIEHIASLQLVRQFGEDYIYLIPTPHPDVVPPQVGVYFPQPVAPQQNWTAFLILQNQSRQGLAFKPTSTLHVAARWSDGTTQDISVAPPLVTSSVSVIPIRVQTPRTSGTYQLALHISGPSVAEQRVAGQVIVAEGEPARQVVIPARVEMPASLKTTFALGENIIVKLTWLPLNKIDAYYSASVRVMDAAGNKVVAQDRQPSLPTLLWTPGVPVADEFTLTLPHDLLPGEYSLQVLMYQADLGLDALLLDENYTPRESITLGKFIVK